jgi:hypothetical protein
MGTFNGYAWQKLNLSDKLLYEKAAGIGIQSSAMLHIHASMHTAAHKPCTRTGITQTRIHMSKDIHTKRCTN